MTRALRWGVTAAAAAAVFVGCLSAVRTVSFDWMPTAEADRWVVASAFATVMATVVAAAVGWWAGREQPPPPVEGTVMQRATVSGHGRATQVGGSQNTSRTGPASGGVPQRVEQGAEVSEDATVIQVAGDQHTRPGDDEPRPRP